MTAKALKWWPLLAGTFALLLSLGTAIWAVSAANASVDSRIGVVEVWKTEHVETYGHPETIVAVTRQGEQLRALEKSVTRLEAVAVRLEARAN